MHYPINKNRKKIIAAAVMLALLLSGCLQTPQLPTADPSVPSTVPTEGMTKPPVPTVSLTEPTSAPTQPTTEPTQIATEPMTTVPETVPETEPTIPQPTIAAAEPGKRTLTNLLATALLPVGQTMYVWGGGWNETDDGSGIDSVTIGVSPRWKEFFLEQDSSYDHNNTRFQIHDGLDCSGYIGWVIYNTMNTESGGEGFVVSSSQIAQSYSDRGFGELTLGEFRPGDIVSMERHAWICIGACEDGSVVLVHSSPAGVSICGTTEGESSQATTLAQRYMEFFFPEWYDRYPNCSRSASSYLEGAVGILRWNRETLSDPDCVEEMDAEQVLIYLLGMI